VISRCLAAARAKKRLATLAGDEKHESNGAEEHEQLRAGISARQLVEGSQMKLPVRRIPVRVFLVDPARDGCQIGLLNLPFCLPRRGSTLR